MAVGDGFADYGFAQLLRAGTNEVAANLFTARTQPSGVIASGRDLPDLEATLTPGNVYITPGTDWDPLGSSSGACYESGCGHTGWVQSYFEVETAGSYQLRFGTAN